MTLSINAIYRAQQFAIFFFYKKTRLLNSYQLNVHCLVPANQPATFNTNQQHAGHICAHTHTHTLIYPYINKKNIAFVGIKSEMQRWMAIYSTTTKK